MRRARDRDLHAEVRTPRRTHGPAKKSLEQKKTWIIGSVVVFPLAALIYAQVVAPQQEVKNQDAVERAEDARMEKKAALISRVEKVWEEGQDGKTWIFPKELSKADLSPINKKLHHENWVDGLPPSDADLLKDFGKFGGQRTSDLCNLYGSDCRPVSRYKLTLTGNRSSKVHIGRIYAQITAVKPALLGSIATMPPEAGGSADRIYIDLDSPNTNAWQFDKLEDLTTGGEFTLRENRWAEEDEPLDFIVMAGTKRRVTIEWELKVQVSYDEKRETITVREPNGLPLKTFGYNRRWPYKAAFLNLRDGRGYTTHDEVDWRSPP